VTTDPFIHLVTIASLACLGAGAAGCKAKEASAAPTPTPAAHVETALVAEQSVPKLVTLTGTLEAGQRTDLAANASGRVLRTFVERGQRVARGQILATLDTRLSALSLEEAKANAVGATAKLENARANCARYDQLLANRAITQKEYDQASSDCRVEAASEDAARLRAEEASQTLRDGAIRAPFAGVIGERFVSVGDYVHQDTRVVTLLDEDALRLQLSVPEANVPALHEGLAVTFGDPFHPGATFSAVLTYMGSEIRPSTRDMVVEAVAANNDGRLFPGTFVTASLQDGAEVLPTIPARALVHVGANDAVFVVTHGKLEQRAVRVGAPLDDAVVIKDGLTKGERVVVAPPADLVDGTLVD
jgi:RND family efflux transporter MFP subunit